jgi:protein phosphatase 2C family protein 2/3
LDNLFLGKVNKFEESYINKTAIKENNIIGYSYNSNKGIVRNYNEDRITCLTEIQKPDNKILSKENLTWPKISYFAIFDGHGGSSVSEWLSNHLHLFIINENSFPENPKTAILEGFKKADEFIITNLLKDSLDAKYPKADLKLSSKNISSSVKKKHDCSGSCAIITMIIDKECFVINLGDSRGLLSLKGMSRLYTLTNDHKPDDIDEMRRIESNGGNLWKLGQSPIRVMPGGLSVIK